MTVKLIEEINTKDLNTVQLFKAEPSDYADLNKKLTVLLIGVFHGDESEGEQLLQDLIQEINLKPEIIKNNTILFIPALNPDGKALNTRGNANKVDLNRNFPTKNWQLSEKIDEFFSGPAPASEIETQFLIKIIDQYRPDIILTIHNPYKIVNYDGPAKELAEKISKLTGYSLQQDIGYPTPGSFGTYAGIELNIPVITLELPDNTDIKILWSEIKPALMYILSLNKSHNNIDIDKIIETLEKAQIPKNSFISYMDQNKDPFKTLIACILSLRTKDEVTYGATLRLFNLASNPQDFLKFDLSQIQEAIYPVGFYRNKSEVILGICKDLIEKYNSKVPETIEELLKLKGVGRKTANLVMAKGYNKPAICVDTHVHRISNRIGYVKTNSPDETEMDLRDKLPEKYWLRINDLLVTFGQNICKPVKPSCKACPINKYCLKIL